MRDVNSLNKVILIGHLGADPELRYIPQTDRAVANFSLATNEQVFKPDSDERDSRTEWHRIVVWGKLAEFAEKYLSKGKQILLEGRLRTEKWQDQEGNKRQTTKIHAYNITMLGKRDDYTAKSPTDSQKTHEDFPAQKKSIPDIQTGEDDDEVPF